VSEVPLCSWLISPSCADAAEQGKSHGKAYLIQSLDKLKRSNREIYCTKLSVLVMCGVSSHKERRWLFEGQTEESLITEWTLVYE